jgi:PAS domain S-box-containing protein
MPPEQHDDDTAFTMKNKNKRTTQRAAKAEIGEDEKNFLAEEHGGQWAGYLRQIIDFHPVRMAYLDSQERFRYVNDAYLEWIKLPKDQAIGRTVEDILGSCAYAEIAPYIRNALAGEKVHFEISLGYRDGGRRHVMVDYTPNIDDHGEVLGFFAMIVDLTGRKQAEEEKARLAAVVEYSSDAIISKDFENRILTWNRGAEKIFGYSAGEMIGRPMNILYPEEFDDGMAEKLDRLRNNEEVPAFESRRMKKSGGLLDVLISLSPITDVNGTPIAVSAIIRDISERIRLELELRALNENLEMKVRERTAEIEMHVRQLQKLAMELTQTEQRERQRLGMLLHNDLQQQLVAGKLLVERLMKRLKIEENIGGLKQILSVLENSAETAHNLAVELRPPVLHGSTLAEAVHWLADWFRHKFGFSVHLDIRENFDNKKIPVEVTAFLFEAARELLFNAVKHAGVDTVDLVLRLDDNDCLHLVVSDEGWGTDKDVLNLRENAEPGIGLLSIRERLQLLGGDFRVNTAKGKGFQADIRVPYFFDGITSCAPQNQGENPDRGESGPQAAADSFDHREGRIRVLLADDHAIVREGLRMILEEESDILVVGEAANGREAVELAAGLTPDVCLMDVNMPFMNGIEATRAIAGQTPGTCVIGLSVNDDPRTMSAMIAAGAVAYHKKSDPPELLCGTIRDCARLKLRI